MSATIPASHIDLLQRPICAALSTLMPDGQPQITLVWFDYDGTHLRIPTVPGRQKVKNMQARPRVSLVVVDPDNPYRYIEVRGVLDEVTDHGAMQHLGDVTRAYMGVDNFYGAVAPAELEGKEQRVICKIRPVKVIAYGKGAEQRDQMPELDQYHR